MRNSRRQSPITVARKHSISDALKRKPQRPLRNKKTPKHMPKGMEKWMPVWGMRVLPQGVEPSIAPPLAGELDGRTYTEVSFNSDGTLRPIDISPSPSSLQIHSPSFASVSGITTPSLSFTECSPDSPFGPSFAQPELSSKQYDSWDSNADPIYGPENDVILPSYYDSIESDGSYSALLQDGTFPPPIISQMFHTSASEEQYGHKNPPIADCSSYFSVSNDSLLECNTQGWLPTDSNPDAHIYSPSPHPIPATFNDFGLSEELTNSSPTFTATRGFSITNFQFPPQLDTLDSLTLTRFNSINTSRGPSTFPCEPFLDIYPPNWQPEPRQYPQNSIDYLPHIPSMKNTLAPPPPRYPPLNSYVNQKNGISSFGILGNGYHDFSCLPFEK